VLKEVKRLDLKKLFNSEVEKQKQQKMRQVLSVLKARTPVDTGNARDGWMIEGDQIVNRVDYIDDLNRGTSKQAPSYFVESSCLSVRGVYPNGTIVKSPA
jgi:hypothetical protein